MSAQENFELYLKRYCESYKCDPEEATKHLMVQDVKRYYEEQEAGVKET